MRIGIGHFVGVLRMPCDDGADLGEHAWVHSRRRVRPELRQHLVGRIVHHAFGLEFLLAVGGIIVAEPR